MTREQDLERELATWLADGPTTAPAESVDAALVRIEQRAQRPWLPARLRGAFGPRFPDRSDGGRLLRVVILILLLVALLFALLVIGLPIAGRPGPDEGFVFEELAPGVRRLVTDGAGHFPSATYIREARDMDRLAVDERGWVIVWSSPHDVDNWLDGGCQRWTLGEEGTVYDAAQCDRAAGRSRTAPDGSTWSLADHRGGGVLRTDGSSRERFLVGRRAVSIAITPDGRVWVAVGHPPGAAGGIFVIEPDAEGDPVDVSGADAAAPAGLRSSWRADAVPVARTLLVPFAVGAAPSPVLPG